MLWVSLLWIDDLTHSIMSTFAVRDLRRIHNIVSCFDCDIFEYDLLIGHIECSLAVFLGPWIVNSGSSRGFKPNCSIKGLQFGYAHGTYD